MKQKKNKGRKIYKTKEKNYYGKSFGQKLFSVCLTVLLIGGMGFLGYSTAEPLLDFTRKKGDEPEIQEETTVLQDSEENQESSTETTEENTDSPVINQGNPRMTAVLSVTDIIDTNTLQNALKRIPESAEIEYVALPLKVKGGNVCYNTSCSDAVDSGAIVSRIELDDAVKIIKEAGFRPSAIISTFADNILPLSISESGYKNAEQGKLWLDNPDELIGKPCTTPFSDNAVSYNGFFVREASMAGFETIICSDFTFPEFTQKELSVMDQRLLNEHERSSVLAKTAESYREKAEYNNADFYIEVSASDILKERADILNPDTLKVKNIIVNIDTDEIKNGVDDGKTVYEFSGTPSDIAEKMLGLICGSLGDYSVTIRISGENADFSELLKAKNKIAESGYNSFLIG